MFTSRQGERDATDAASRPRAKDLPLVVFLGDSLTAAAGLSQDASFPTLVHDELERAGVPFRYVNAGVSGDTSAGGLRRVDWLLRQKPAIVVVGLGGNDGMRGLSAGEMEKNLRAIITRSQKSGARVLLLGMKVPPNYGHSYCESFDSVFPRLAKELDVPLVPFMLEGVGGVSNLNLADGVHPNAEGYKIVAHNVLAYLRDLIESLR